MMGWLRRTLKRRARRSAPAVGGRPLAQPVGVLKRPDGTPYELVLYKFDACPYCARVMRHIDGLGIELDYRDTRKDRAWRDDLRQKTGRTQVPCLFIDGKPMFESADINRWLSAQAQEQAARAQAGQAPA